jgi:hypothetical protein
MFDRVGRAIGVVGLLATFPSATPLTAQVNEARARIDGMT